MIVRNGNRQSETRSAIALSNLLNELVDELVNELLPMEVFNEIISYNRKLWIKTFDLKIIARRILLAFQRVKWPHFVTPTYNSKFEFQTRNEPAKPSSLTFTIFFVDVSLIMTHYDPNNLLDQGGSRKSFVVMKTIGLT